MASTDEWHLDKRVPIALIFVLITQFAAGAYVAGKMNSQIQTLDRDIETNSRTIELMRTNSQAQAVQLGRIEENIIGLREDFKRLLEDE